MVATAAQISLTLLTLSFLIAFIRLIKGPSLPDRVISLDLISSLSMGIITTFVIISNKTIYLDIVLIIALITFLGTVTVAKYLKESQRK